MKIVCALVLTCTTAVSALARDSAEMLRDPLIFCNQFVIEHAESPIVRDSTQYCCRLANRIHDCHAHDWDEVYR